MSDPETGKGLDKTSSNNKTYKPRVKSDERVDASNSIIGRV